MGFLEEHTPLTWDESLAKLELDMDESRAKLNELLN